MVGEQVWVDKDKAIERINAYVKQWTEKYIFFTTYYRFDPLHGETFETIFSLPQKHKPIPEAIIKVYFYLKTDDSPMTFRFENDSLIHKEGFTLRTS